MTTQTSDPVTLPDVFIGRQPIYDRQLRVMGYELLYRANHVDRAEINNADFATSQVVLNAFAEMGLDRIVGNKKAFINLTRNFFLEKYPIPFLPDQVILEIPENIQVDDDLAQAIRAFKQRGFQIALDDVSLVSNVLPLLKLADIVKLDILAIDRQRLPGIITALRKSNLLLLAEKVETRDEFNLCNELGFDYFQGYFLCRPETIQSKKLPTSRMVILQLINKIQNPYVDFKALEEILAQDVILSYKLLRLVNSSYYSPSVRIDSIQQAVSYIGLEQLRGWLVLFLLSKTGDKPRELTILSLIRARMCEMIARQTRQGRPETHFLIGLFSMLDALMDMSMDQILASVALSDEAVAALVEHKGPMGAALSCAIAYERGDWNNVQFQNLEISALRDIYLETLVWVSKMASALEI